MKLLIAIPSARYIETDCMVSLFEMKLEAMDSKEKIQMELFIPNSYSVDVSRNVIAKYAQENEFDYVMWVDSDIILPKNTLTRLLSHDKDIVAGVYSYKLLNNKNAVAKRLKQEEDYDDVPLKEIRESTGIIPIDAVGFGCVLTKVSVFDKIQYPWFIYTLEMGEDVYFCRKAQNVGLEIFLDTEVRCGHIGSVNYNI